MNSKRLYFVLLGIIGVLFIGLIAGAYGTNKLLTSRADTLIGLKAKGQALDQEQQSLISAKKDIQKYGSLEQTAKIIVPQDKDQAEAVREIVNLASQNGINLTSVTFPSSTLGSSTVNPSASSTSSTTTTTLPSTATSTNSPLNRLSQLEAIKNIPGVYLLQITITNDTKHAIAYGPFINFLSDLEHNRRTAQVSTINLQPTTDNTSLFTFSLTLNEYIKP